MIQHISYECEHCARYKEGQYAENWYGDLNDIKEHEEKCEHNPKNKACFSCKHFVGMKEVITKKTLLIYMYPEESVCRIKTKKVKDADFVDPEYTDSDYRGGPLWVSSYRNCTDWEEYLYKSDDYLYFKEPATSNSVEIKGGQA